jgi:phosphoadenosine phosphosulfate reductase
MTYEKKVESAIRLIQSVGKKEQVIVAYSGGKDSDVLRTLCRYAGVDYKLVYNSTTIDPPGTISHCQHVGATIVRPAKTFFELIAKKGLPSLSRRFCCRELKEKFIAPRLLLGVRAAESVKRQKLYTEPTSCFVYNSKCSTERILPLFNWTDDDIHKFVVEERVFVHPLYYDDNGRFHVERRLGCLGCPLQGDRGKADFLQYPKLLRQWCRSYSQYVSTHKFIEGVYEDIIWHIFYSNHGNQKYQQSFHGLFEKPNAKAILENYFNIDL